MDRFLIHHPFDCMKSLFVSFFDFMNHFLILVLSFSLYVSFYFFVINSIKLLIFSAFDFMGRRFVFGMQHIYTDKGSDPDCPRHPVVYLASLAKDPVEVTITAPVANDPFTVSIYLLRREYVD